MIILKILALAWGASFVALFWMMRNAPLCDENQQPIRRTDESSE